MPIAIYYKTPSYLAIEFDHFLPQFHIKSNFSWFHSRNSQSYWKARTLNLGFSACKMMLYIPDSLDLTKIWHFTYRNQLELWISSFVSSWSELAFTKHKCHYAEKYRCLSTRFTLPGFDRTINTSISPPFPYLFTAFSPSRALTRLRVLFLFTIHAILLPSGCFPFKAQRGTCLVFPPSNPIGILECLFRQTILFSKFLSYWEWSFLNIFSSLWINIL